MRAPLPSVAAAAVVATATRAAAATVAAAAAVAAAVARVVAVRMAAAAEGRAADRRRAEDSRSDARRLPAETPPTASAASRAAIATFPVCASTAAFSLPPRRLTSSLCQAGSALDAVARTL